MFSKISIISAPETQNYNSISELRLYKQNLMLKNMELKFYDQKLIQTQKAKELGISECTFKNFKNDISVDSLYHRNVG